jgi:hypothetical protein
LRGAVATTQPIATVIPGREWSERTRNLVQNISRFRINAPSALSGMTRNELLRGFFSWGRAMARRRRGKRAFDADPAFRNDEGRAIF